MARHDARENSVKQLSELYNVVAGAALALAITKIIDLNAPVLPIKSEPVLCFLSFLIIIIPFHQGAVRHLFATYVEGGASTRIQRGALAFDFLILFVEGCLFVALALLIEKPNLFTIVIIALLALDCVWGFLATIAFVGAQAQTAEKKWSIINLAAAAILVLAYIFGPPLLQGWNIEMKIVVLLICLLRTITDYYWSWDFYYPN
jgi:hypothetical protein